MNENIFAYRRVIPPHLYTCWHTKLPPCMKENYDWMVRHNPEMTFHVYDESSCRQFIQENFDPCVVDAYDILVPYAYKSDLWRYCILYIHGGIYLDIKYRCVPPFRLVELTEKEHFVRDLTEGCVYTALIVARPRNEIMLRCIHQIVHHVKTQFYGRHALDPTGPGLLGYWFTWEERKQLPLYHRLIFRDRVVRQVVGKEVMLEDYSQYKEDQKQVQKKYYADLWKEQSIYFQNDPIPLE